MYWLIWIALLAWVALGPHWFSRYSPRLATLIVFVAGVLLLPEINFPKAVPEAPDALGVTGVRLTKLNVLAYAFLFGSLVYDYRRWLTMKWSWVDLPMLLLVVSPFASSVANEIGDDLGFHDGLSSMLAMFLNWGVPYLAGRLYFGTESGLRLLGWAMIVGTVLYLPLIAFEWRMSPQVHRLVYGFAQSNINQTVRFDGYRPMVFLSHGLMLGMWVCFTAVAAAWLLPRGYLSEFTRRLWWNRELGTILVAVLVLVAVAVKSTGAIALALAAYGLLIWSRRTNLRWVMLAALLIPTAYCWSRATNLWDGNNLVEAIEKVNVDRAQSLYFRFYMEGKLVEKALERPTFGWAGWNRARVKDEEGQDRSVSDGLWIIHFGNYGVVGLIACVVTILLPAARWFWRFSAPEWVHYAPGAQFTAVLLTMVMIDNLFNAFPNPLWLLMAGGLNGFTDELRRIKPAA